MNSEKIRAGKTGSDRQNAKVKRKLILRTEYERFYLPRKTLKTIAVFSQAFHSYERAAAKAGQAIGITGSQLVTLWILLLMGRPMQPSEISRLVPIEASSVSSLLDRLAERKLIKRRRMPNDRRAVEVTLTEQGGKLAEKLAPDTRKSVVDVYNTLSDKELDQFIILLGKIRDASMSVLGVDENHAEDYWEKLFWPSEPSQISKRK